MAEELDLVLYRGDTKVVKVTVTEGMIYDDEDNDEPLDITGYDVNAQVRRSFNSEVVLGEFEVNMDDAATGELTLYLHAAVTEDIDVGDAGVWDLEIASPGATPIVTTTHAGVVTFAEDVTRDE